jgi:hypothetical protein
VAGLFAGRTATIAEGRDYLINRGMHRRKKDGRDPF